MKAVEVNDLTFSYSGDDRCALKNVTFDVDRGDIVLIIGESGCGKTTLLRHLKSAYTPEGRREKNSRIRINGKPIEKQSDREAAFSVGFVGQMVDETSVTDKVWHEIAFGLESMGCTQSYMQLRVAEISAFFGLGDIYHEKISELSGGQKQIVNLAAVMAMEPEILVLDEPTSQLDPNSAREFIGMLKKIHEELGTTIIITEHRLEDIMPMADKVLVMSNGEKLCFGAPHKVCAYLSEKRLSLFRALPAAARIYMTVEGANEYNKGECLTEKNIPLSVNDGRSFIQGYMEKNGTITQDDDSVIKCSPDKRIRIDKKKCAVAVDEVWFRYKKGGRDVLKACSIEVEKGSITAVLGGNGAGKSTLLHLIKGNLKPTSGKVKCDRSLIGLLPQNPQAMFAADSVKEELEISNSYGERKQKNQSDNESGRKEEADKCESLIKYFDLKECLYKHPFDLSGGQMEKLALAKLILEDYDILLLDEPGKGMDYAFKEKLGEYLKALAASGKTIVLVSHDVEFCAKYADYCGMFFDGHIVTTDVTKTFFLRNSFYTTAVRRMCRGILPVVTIADVYDSLGVMEPDTDNDDAPPQDEDMEVESKEGAGSEDAGTDDEALSVYDVESNIEKSGNRKLYHIFSFALLFVVMPLTIYIGYALLHQRKYYFISLMLIVEAMTALFLSFEGKRLQMRDIMTIAVMSTLTALSRAMFYMMPAVKPMAALTIISGIGLGGISGFVVGALSMLVSDIFFGQGPWTPWQMFAMGFLGLLAGLFFERRDRYHLSGITNNSRTLLISIFGAVVVFMVYGGIMNPASVIMYQENVSGKMLLASYATGFPIDVIHAISTGVFLWFLTEPMLKKYARVKKK